ncbi:MAG: PQQ-binding-like beta-propeller repeat protein [Candidatus Latescibacteria bacterium]|nr:PQQ-binding-like beta-propeller repeat protein [Candidatus Latescibacterota bacterium]
MSVLYRSLCLLVISCIALPVGADWAYYGGDEASTKFAPYEQIDADNVDSLRIVWRWRLPEMQIEEDDEEEAGGMGGDGSFKSTPVVVDGVLYTSTPYAQVTALDAITGEQLWFFDPKAWQTANTFKDLHRGVAYWSDGDRARIFFGTAADSLYSLDARTGLPDPAFGQGGRVDLTKGLVRPPDPERYALISPPTVCRDVVVVGSTIMDWHSGSSPEPYSSPGDVRGYDARTGELLWTFHTVPQEGEYGNDTWEGDSWRHFGQANAWAAISADSELGYVYLSLSTPSHNWYGGERPGANLFGDSIVCLDARTGERVWHYQLVHHGLWNYDPPAPPVLLDIMVGGLPIRAVAMVTKQAYAYVFDRVSGDPVWPIEEKPVPASTVPGEQAWPTQPVPSKPAPYDRQGLAEDDLIDFTPQLRAEALEIITPHRYGPLFTPPSEEGTIAVPGDLGGTDWAGAAADPRHGVLFVPSRTLPFVHRLIPSDSTAFSRYGGFGNTGPEGPQGLPLTKPPYGRLTAIDLNSGEHIWMRPMGRGPVDHPALRDLSLDEDLGWTSRVFVVATPQLLFTASGRPWSGGGYFVDPEADLLALDPTTGAELARIPLPANANGGLLSYEAAGRQYVVVPVGGGGGFDLPGELVALAVPYPGEGLPPQAQSGYGADHAAFDQAVDAFDRGDRAELESLLTAHPDLAQARGFLHELYPYPSLRGATLLHLVAGFPQRQRLPDNTLELTRLLLDKGADAQALSADSTSVLGLVVKSAQLRWQEAQMEMVELVVEQGIGDDPRLMWQTMVPDLDNEGPPAINQQLARRFYEGGAAVDLPFAAGLGLVEEMATFFEGSTLLPTANKLYRPQGAGMSDQEVLDLALLYAVYGGHREAVAFILVRGADIDSRPMGGFWEQFVGITALHMAVWADNAEMVAFLLEQGANPMTPDFNFNAPPIGWATYLNKEASLAVLQKAMAAMQEGAPPAAE